MKIFKKNIFIASSPNMQRDDVWLAVRLLFQSWKWKSSRYVDEFEYEIEKYMGAGRKAIAFDSARSSLLLILKEFGIGKGDEIIVPSFTCIVVVNAVLACGAKPVYIDTDPESLNIDLADLDKNITKKTKAILVQHTFGVPIDVKEIRRIVGSNVRIIEDLAHILGGEIDGEKFGTFKETDAAILTFGIEKMMSTMRGGMALVKDEKIYENLKKVQRDLPNFSSLQILSWLINPIVWSLINPLYFIGIGKLTIGRAFSFVGHKIGIMGNMMEGCEYKGCWPKWMPAKMPGVLALIGINQLKKLDRHNEHRREIAAIYDSILNPRKEYSKIPGYTPLRYPVLVKNPVRVHKIFKKEHIILGNWYHKFLFTKKQFLDDVGFEIKEYPKTEKITEHIINLPLFWRVDEKDVRDIVEIVKMYLFKE